MPEPVRKGQRYMPGLDGLRAVAVFAVILNHANQRWLPGGVLGVDVFFTLSGYLITDLLLGQWAATGSLRLGDFWLRRARRLLPALFVMIAVVALWVALADRAQLATLRTAAAAAAGYFSNWHMISQLGPFLAPYTPRPLDHLWSLAVEEQFYLVWPLVIWLGVCLARRGRRGAPALRWFAVFTLAMAAASVTLMTLMYHPGLSTARIYYGTDTRAFALLMGAALAMLRPSRALTGRAGERCVVSDCLGIAGLAAIVFLCGIVGEVYLFRGVMVLASLATMAVVAAVVHPASEIGPMLGWGPLRWLGVRSYGIYLWHYPVIVLTSPAYGAEGLLPFVLQVGGTVAIAALSWRLVEEPIRHGAIGRRLARPGRARRASHANG
jgi:peptidoglycan/LPS O-acetylase OafA/YrhL